MPRLLRFEETPNPHALKGVLDAPLPPAGGSAAPRSYRSPEAAAGDPLARALLGIPGVAGVLLSESFLTITRVPGSDWKAIKQAVQEAVQHAAEGR